jgi:hypothetical protein
MTFVDVRWYTTECAPQAPEKVATLSSAASNDQPCGPTMNLEVQQKTGAERVTRIRYGISLEGVLSNARTRVLNERRSKFL